MIDLGINKLFVEAGTYGYTLKRKVKRNTKDKETGEMRTEDAFDIISYHGSLESALTAALNETVRMRMAAYPDDVSLETAVGELKILHREFADLLKKTVGRYEKVGG